MICVRWMPVLNGQLVESEHSILGTRVEVRDDGTVEVYRVDEASGPAGHGIQQLEPRDRWGRILIEEAPR